MEITNVISINGGWVRLQENERVFSDINTAVSALNQTFISNPKHNRLRTTAITYPLPHYITNLDVRTCLNNYMKRLRWKLESNDHMSAEKKYEATFKKASLSFITLSSSELLDWLFVKSKMGVSSGTVDLPILVSCNKSTKASKKIVNINNELHGNVRRNIRTDQFFFEDCLNDLDSYIDLADFPPMVILGIAFEEGPLEIFEYNQASYTNEDKIERVIEFPEEYTQSCISILSYFGEVVKQKYPDIAVKVRIEQDNNIVRMLITAPDGTKEIIERTLENYALVVTNDSPPESLLEDKVHILALSNKLEMAKLEVKQTRELLALTKENYEGRIGTLEDDVAFLRQKLGQQMHHMDQSQIIIGELSTGKSDLLDSCHQIISKMIEAHQHKPELQSALNIISEAINNKSNEEETIQALQTIQSASPSMFETIKKAAENSLYGVTGNYLFQWCKAVETATTVLP
ncbi:hypothetical protein [Pseudoalteromonas sp. McH1-42]|uniref:hypothetical protein n=1 Tax=Pseudoalteromonas sp. McH1-42 TaxID=2917752 RepID=UPI001EF5FD9C|nr:hypothetical protein [Pseudoalteromonas sp. McH1-42]MCG7561026.1 hypothetical protein [Pseudoalteromonas sp. McH1-42]